MNRTYDEAAFAAGAFPDFEPIVLTSADEGELRVVAEFVEVLGVSG